jgi:hypothetical protein
MGKSANWQPSMYLIVGITSSAENWGDTTLAEVSAQPGRVAENSQSP